MANRERRLPVPPTAAWSSRRGSHSRKTPHAKRPVHAAESPLSVRAGFAPNIGSVQMTPKKNPPLQKNAHLPPGATPSAFPAVDGRIFGYGRPRFYPAAFQRSVSLGTHKGGLEAAFKTRQAPVILSAWGFFPSMKLFCTCLREICICIFLFYYYYYF